MQVLYDALDTFCHHKFTEDKDDLNKRDDYGVPFSYLSLHCIAEIRIH